MQTYRVFGRTAYPQPLEDQGTLAAPGDHAAAAGALERYGADWVELVVLPERHIHWVIQPEGPRHG